MIREAISKLVGGEEISGDETLQVANEIMNGEATPAQIAAFITSLRIQGEKVHNITSFAKVMREKMVRIECDDDIILDTCGTGGDELGTFNISTASALVAAGAGIKVAKHGNKSVSSRCGSADVFEALGVNIKVSKEVSEKCLNEVGICFLFAPLYHPAMKHAIGPRREIGIRTIFNILGPLCNPALANYQLMGVFSEKLTETLAEVLRDLGTVRALVVSGSDGLDELSTTTTTSIAELNEGKIDTYFIDPTQFGIKLASLENLIGGDAQRNAQIILSILHGETSAFADAVVLNAAGAIYVTGKAASIADGVEVARDVISSGAALETLNAFKQATAEV